MPLPADDRMDLEHHPRDDAGEERDGLLAQDAGHGSGKLRRRDAWDTRGFVIVALVLSNLVLAAILVFSNRAQIPPAGADQAAGDVAVVPQLPAKLVQFHWNTPYSSPNDTEADPLWDAISPAHGHIAVDHNWAEQHNWRTSMSVPGTNGSKGLYLLESYHQLHCLKIVRETLLQLARGATPRYPVQHARHCMDYFRQFVMCHADNTPLYTIGDHTAGDGQTHVCKDWDALRNYATENSACFRDRVAFETLEEQFGHCDDGTDGLSPAIAATG